MVARLEDAFFDELDAEDECHPLIEFMRKAK
jgi:hypothetical protein